MSIFGSAYEVHPVRIPLRYRFRRVEHRDAVLIHGPGGWGEFSPFAEYEPNVAASWLASALEAANGELPEPGAAAVNVNVTVPAVDPGVARALVAESGAKTAKVKVGEHANSEIEDEERVDAVRDAIGPAGKIRIDVNASWDVATAARRIEALAKYQLEYVEQPVASIDEMVRLRHMTGVPLAADELVRLGSDPLEVAEVGAADLLVLKVQPLGGVNSVLELAARAELPVVISSALETSVGIYSGLLAASLIPDLSHDCGLGTVALLEGDPTLDPLVPQEGVLEVRRPEPEQELLARWRPATDIADRMLDRVRVVAEELS